MSEQLIATIYGKLKNFNDPITNKPLNPNNSDLKIICLFEKLHSEAIQVGGALFSIFGNQ